jgi:6-pyruvoyltetrahydropterin/6-carboxytetrahydropterin synthase
MFLVTIQTNFTASHQLALADGVKEPLHTHNWQVRTAVSSQKLDSAGFVVDFVDLKAKIESITALFEGKMIDDMPCFKGRNASAENVAKYIFDALSPLIPAQVKLKYVEVMEAEGCWARFQAE